MTYPPAAYSSTVLPFDCQAPRDHWQEWFSWGYVMSVAAAAGLAPKLQLIDANQTDMEVQTWRPFEGSVRTIALQLKSTHAPEFVEDGAYVVHDLTAERYNRLLEQGTVPRFMVVVVVPSPDAALVNLNGADTTLSGVAWWVRVQGEPTDQKYKRVRIPTSQRFDVTGLQTMLRQA